MNRSNFYAVILAGGKGERFWPLSTSRVPKQFLSLVGEKPLLAQAIDRLEGLIAPDNVFVLTNADLIGPARESAPGLPAENIVGEPVGRDTAAAIALGAALVKKRDPNAAFAVLTADHVMGDLDVYRQTLADACSLALEEDVLITIGIRPSEPSTAYGYIEAGEEFRKSSAGTRFLKAERFVEKPDAATAAEYVSSGKFAWNSGMFIWSVKAIEKALRIHRLPLYQMMQNLAPAIGTGAFKDALADAFGALEKISIDYAVMEKADNVLMAEGSFAWDDVGSWPALENHFPKDDRGNTVIGQMESVGAENSIVFSRGRLTALVGVENLIVVQAEGATLICARDKAQDIKQLVQKLRDSGKYGPLL
ncbi:MAG TPA: sugar phosphate nucleotidyltransferase [Kiritimatiellia bacterium]|nr:sugar phosphate nucleotidyltransferase [Kiritimatiellia bacterium]HNR93677.1 sugar phosphate nucleotidyltransferase [Kiritimatiellia bacterium]HNS80369.1 sugar phosphate nucleotidyltransferase [Kiritimatiellia bacterium]HPA78091.1 sugar phosphate nucleotidyltransferase [Kiritimatiellia bacterium]HQQ04333.1 sugar phosphate nucleotidyltransferase [Kiritimatiellia bacterium]